VLQNIQPLDFVFLSLLGITCETQLLGVRSLPVLRRRVKETDDRESAKGKMFPDFGCYL
jgi:hypothetical protein